jgi:hypothetical protein
LSASPTAFTCSNFGNNSVTLTATDSSGNSAQCTATVAVEDNNDPTAICQNTTAQLDGNGDASISTGDVDNGTNDNCESVSLSLSQTNFDCDDVGGNSVTLAATDGSGNTSQCNATVTVEDNIDPAAGCQNVAVQLDAGGNASVTAGDIDDGSTDNCSDISLSASPTSFTCGNLGGNSVTLTVTDGSGNSAQCTATVTVEDNIEPTAICQNTTLQLDGNGDASTSTGDVNNSSNDNCGSVSLSLSQTNFDCDDAGANSVVLTVTDGSGNTSQCNATVTVEDVTNPIATCQSATVVLGGGNVGTLTTSEIDGGSTDNCGITASSLDIASFGCGDVGVNTIELTVRDAASNSATCNASVTVVEGSLVAICQDYVLTLDANGIGTITVNDIDFGSATGCGLATSYVTPANFSCDDAGITHTVTLVLVSTTGDSATCDAGLDVVTPACSAPGNITVADITATTAHIYWDGEPNAVSYELRYRDIAVAT